MWFVFSPNIEQRKQIYDCKANSLGVMWCSYIERKNRLLTNRLHGKAAELCLANGTPENAEYGITE